MGLIDDGIIIVTSSHFRRTTDVFSLQGEGTPACEKGEGATEDNGRKGVQRRGYFQIDQLLGDILCCKLRLGVLLLKTRDRICGHSACFARIDSVRSSRNDPRNEVHRDDSSNNNPICPSSEDKQNELYQKPSGRKQTQKDIIVSTLVLVLRTSNKVIRNV